MGRPERGTEGHRGPGRSGLGLVMGLCLGIGLTGCQRAGEVTDAVGTRDLDVPALGQPAQPETPLPPPPAPIAAVAENRPRKGVTGQVDPFLTEQLRIFVKQAGRFPVSFAEFAAQRLDSVPGAPPGHRWVIDVETLTVKAVPVP